MRLEFDSITIAHFKAFTDPQTLSFADLGEGLVFMRGRNEVEPRLGSNGASKSSVWDALTWCLFGATASGLRNPDVKPWGGGKKVPEVTVTVYVGNILHTIKRRAVTNGLTIDGKEVASTAAEALIGMSLELFTNTVLQAQAQPLFFDRTARAKLELLTGALNLERWEGYSKRASNAAKELEEIAADIQNELSGVAAAKEQAEELLIRAERDSAQWDKELEEWQLKLQLELNDLRKKLEVQEAELGEAQLEADSAGTEAKALREELEELREKANVAYRKWQIARAEHGSASDAHEQKLAQLEGLGNTKECPTCGQPVKASNLRAHRKELENEIDAAHRHLVRRGKLVAELQSASDQAQDQLSRQEIAAKEFIEREDKANTRLRFLLPQVAELRTKVTTLKTTPLDKPNPHTDQINVLKQKLRKLKTQEEELVADAGKAAEKLASTRYWVKGFKDVALYLLEEVMGELEVATNTSLAEGGLEGWRVRYALEKETKAGSLQRGLTVEILSPRNEGLVRYESWSGGEGQRLRVLGALALSDVLLARMGLEVNLEVLDEPTRHLSSTGVSDLCGILAARAKAHGKQVWLIDHMARESRDFAQVVTVVKTPEGAVIDT